jgi:hypothetical protein
MINTTNYDGIYNVKIFEQGDCLIVEEFSYGDGCEGAIKISNDGFIQMRYLHETEWFDINVSTISYVQTLCEDNKKYIDEFMGV